LRRLPILRPAFRLTSSLRLRSIFRLTYKPNLRLSSAAAFSSCLRTDMRLAPPTDSPASPSCQPLAFASGQPSGCSFKLASDFRRLPTFQPPLSNPTSDSHRLLDSMAATQTDLRLTPPTDPPASPSCQPLAFASGQPSGCVFHLTFDLRLRSTFRPCL